MFVETKTIIVTEGYADKVVDRFSGQGAIEQADGFIDLSVLVKKVRRGDEEVLIVVRWESESDWKKWETSEPHLEGHRKERGKPKPDFLVNSYHGLYEVKAVKHPVSN